MVKRPANEELKRVRVLGCSSPHVVHAKHYILFPQNPTRNSMRIRPRHLLEGPHRGSVASVPTVKMVMVMKLPVGPTPREAPPRWRKGHADQEEAGEEN